MNDVTSTRDIPPDLWDNLLAAVRAVADIPEAATLARETHMRQELGIRSVDLLGIAFELEERYDINIAQAAPEMMQTLGEAHDLVARLIAERAEGAR